jgi:hypothetical protein
MDDLLTRSRLNASVERRRQTARERTTPRMVGKTYIRVGVYLLARTPSLGPNTGQ